MFWNTARLLVKSGGLAVLGFLISRPWIPAQNPEPAGREGLVKEFSGTFSSIQINNPGGDIELQSWAFAQIRVSARRRNPDPAGLEQDVMTEEAASGTFRLWTRPTLSGEQTIDLCVSVPASIRANLRSQAGHILIDGRFQGLTGETSQGDIICRLASPLDADLSLRAPQGKVETSLNVELFGSPEPHGLDGRLGAGGIPVVLRSLQGNIHLQRSAVSDTQQAGASPFSAAGGPAAGQQAGGKEPEAGPPVPSPGTRSAASNDQDPPGFRISVSTRLVNLNVHVSDEQGKAVPDLVKEDFSVWEGGVLQDIVHFETGFTPVSLVLLLDLSGSTKDKMKVIRQAAIRFTEMLRPGDRVGVAAFTTRYMVVSPFTTDRSLLRKRIEDLENREGGTAFYEAMWYTLDGLAEAESAKMVIVVMTDGVDNVLQDPKRYSTKFSFEQLLQRVTAGEVTVYPLYLDTEYETVVKNGRGNSVIYKQARGELKKLSEASGGTMFTVARIQDLEGAYRQVATELGSLFRLGYYPSNPAPRQPEEPVWRPVEVGVGRPGVKARCRPGYFQQ